MKPNPSDSPEEPMPLEDRNDPLWQLLGQTRSARNSDAGPAFVQNVVREARLSASEQSAGTSLLSRRFNGLLEKLQRPAFAIPAAATAAIAIAVAVSLSQSGQSGNGGSLVGNPSPPSDVSTTDTNPTASYTVAEQLDDIDYLGELVAVTDPGVLDDQMLADLLY
jgi:hypothetical protein